MHRNDTQELRVETVQQEQSHFHRYNVMVLLEWSVLPTEQGMTAAMKETTLGENSDRVDMEVSMNFQEWQINKRLVSARQALLCYTPY